MVDDLKRRTVGERRPYGHAGYDYTKRPGRLHEAVG